MDLKSESGPRWEAQFFTTKPDASEIFKELDVQACNTGRIVGRQTAFQFPVHGPEHTGRIWGLIPQPRSRVMARGSLTNTHGRPRVNDISEQRSWIKMKSFVGIKAFFSFFGDL